MMQGQLGAVDPAISQDPPIHAAQTLALLQQHQQQTPSQQQRSHFTNSYQPTTAQSAPAMRAKSAESIAPMETIQALIDDYFTFIYPLIPAPDKPSFMLAFQHREDKNNPKFLALTAAMVGCLAASFPRRVSVHIQRGGILIHYGTLKAFSDRCNQILHETLGYLEFQEEFDITDVVITYLRGITAEYMFQRHKCLFYLRQGISMCTTLGLHKKKASSTLPDDQTQHQSNVSVDDTIERDMAARVWWLYVVTVESIRQLGCSSAELQLPMPTVNQPYPDLLEPIAVSSSDSDGNRDDFLRLYGFSANVRIYQSYDAISRGEVVHGVNRLYKWKAQQNHCQRALAVIQSVLDDLPAELRIDTTPTATGAHPDPAHSTVASAPGPSNMFHQFPANGYVYGYQQPLGNNLPHFKDIQKANIYVSAIATRSYVVEKYFTLRSQVAEPAVNGQNKPSHTSSPASSDSLSPEPTTLIATTKGSKTQGVDPEVDRVMERERRQIITDFLRVMATIKPGSMEPNGGSLVHKVRSIGVQLLGAVQKQQTRSFLKSEGREETNGMPTTDDEYNRAEHDLSTFLDVLDNLEHGVASNTDAFEAQSRAWGNLQAEAEAFARAGGFVSK